MFSKWVLIDMTIVVSTSTDSRVLPLGGLENNCKDVAVGPGIVHNALDDYFKWYNVWSATITPSLFLN